MMYVYKNKAVSLDNVKTVCILPRGIVVNGVWKYSYYVQIGYFNEKTTSFNSLNQAEATKIFNEIVEKINKKE